jgi:uncharacterized membrane protein
MPELNGFESFGPFLSLFLTVALSGLIIWGLCQLFNCGYNPPEQSPQEILRQRFANGEISQAEYEQARPGLQQS